MAFNLFELFALMVYLLGASILDMFKQPSPDPYPGPVLTSAPDPDLVPVPVTHLPPDPIPDPIPDPDPDPPPKPDQTVPIPSTPPLAEFHLFPKLPAEIRIQIWNHALAIPCVVGYERLYQYYAEKRIQFASKSLPHTISRVNLEARYETYKYKYRIHLKSRYFRKFRGSGKCPNYIVVNLKAHTLWLTIARTEDLLMMLHKLRGVRCYYGSHPEITLAIPLACLQEIFRTPEAPEVNRDILTPMRAICRSGLRKLIISVDQPNKKDRDNVEFVPVSQPLMKTYTYVEEMNLLDFVSEICKWADPNVTRGEIVKLEKLGEKEWKILGKKVSDGLERVRVEKCKEVQMLRDQGLRPDEFDKALEKNDLIGFEYWQIPTVCFMETKPAQW